MSVTYTYNRKDGGTCECYGTIEENSNFCIAYGDELEGIAADIDGGTYDTWLKVCRYLEVNFHTEIEQIETC